ncbi:MAG: GGDEF domain-containing protein [Candidatus Thiodiazotropha sp.]
MPLITSRLDWSPKAQVSIVLSGTLVILSMMSFVFYLGHRIAGHHAPLVDATLELKLQITTGHLWFEEIVSGDSNESIDAVWNSLDRADWYAKSLLHGGNNLQVTYPALENEHLRQLISSVRSSLDEFRQITQHRYLKGGAAGSEIDQRYDAIFTDVLNGAEDVELAVLALIKREYNQYQTLGYSLLFMAILAMIFMLRLIYNNGLANQKLVSSIAETNRTIEAQNKELDYKAHFDALTGLPNRVLFLDRVNQSILQAKRDGYSFALLYADFDHFKHINDVFGHAAGDHALRLIAERLLTCIRESDTAARISGDEFGIILNNKAQSHLDQQVCRNMATKINQVMRQPIPFKEHALHSSVSIGIAIYPENGDTAEQLMVNADAAMYQAKTQGKDRFGFYTQQLGQAIHEQNHYLSLIRQALREDQLLVHYQPQILPSESSIS